MGNVSRERLRRFFVETETSVRVSKPLRDMCVFSRHNLMADPPFSRMDLITCRNLLIYLEPSSQQRILPILHYALKPRGYLVLGASETVGPFRNLFGVEDGKHKIYARKSRSVRVPLPPPAPGTAPARSDRSKETRAPARIAPGLGARDLHTEADRLLLGLAPAAVLVDPNFQILQFRGHTEPYLAPAQGRASFMLLRMARPGLLAPLRGLMSRAKRSGKPVREERVQVGIGGRARDVDVRVCPVKGPSATEHGYLVVFSDSPAPRPRGKTGSRRRPAVAKGGRESAAANTVRLEHEMAGMREYVRSLSEEHDAAIEELQSANEEAQSANEELQSINEELETSKEEIQSSNEELSTVNDELNSRNLEMGRLNNDLANLISSVHVAIVIVTRDLRIRHFSPMAEKLLSIIPADVGRPISDIRLMIDVPDLESLLTEVIDSLTPMEREVQAKDQRWYSLRIRPYMTLEKRIEGAVLVMMDVNESRRAREYAESIVETVGQPILILDADLRVRRANRSFYETFRVARGSTEGRLVYELGNHQWDIPDLRRLLGEILPTSSVIEDFVVEHDFEHIGPKAMQLNARRLIAPGEERESILLAIADVTGRLAAEQERARIGDQTRERAETLEAANRTKADFIAVLSHELRTPVNAITGWAEILKRPDASDDDRRKGVEVIARNSRIQAQLISDLLDSQRIASGRLSLNLRSLDLRAEVEAATEAVIPSTLEKRVRLLLDIDTEGPVVVRADSARLQQVFGNLLANAVKFTPEGGEIRVGLLRKGACAEVFVRDSGQGIDADALPHLFERFRQYEPQAARIQGSLGLGLAVSRQLVDLHGGSISAESAGKGKGATFTVSLPFIAEALPAVVPEAGTSTVSLQRTLVLVVDDDPEAREPVRRVLEEHGAEVLAVKSADEALEALQHVQPDVMVSDIGMPERDGYHLIRAIRALPPERGGRMPAVALTALGTSGDRELARRAGYTSHLVKPVQSSDLIAAVAALLGGGGGGGGGGGRGRGGGGGGRGGYIAGPRAPPRPPPPPPPPTTTNGREERERRGTGRRVKRSFTLSEG
jgi:two-component system CheB/CheR fusion protein